MKARIAKLAAIATLAAGAIVGPAAVAVAAEPIGPTGEAETIRRVSDIVRPSIVSLDTSFSASVYDTYNRQFVNNGEPFAAYAGCTGFFVSPHGHIGTAAHCVDNSDAESKIIANAIAWSEQSGYWRPGESDEAKVDFINNHWVLMVDHGNGPEPGFDKEHMASYSLDGETTFGEMKPARVFGERKIGEGDVAVLQIDAKNTPALELARDGELELGQSITSVGYASKVEAITQDFSHKPSFIHGTAGPERKMMTKLHSVYEVNLAIAPGMSGGPTVDDEGRVVGINSFGADEATEAFNFISPVAELEGVIEASGITAELGEMSNEFQAAVRALHVSDREAAVEGFEAVLKIEPDYELAREHLIQAEKLEQGGAPVAPLLILLGLLAGGGVYGLRKFGHWPGAQGGATGSATKLAGPGKAAPSRSALVTTAGPLTGKRFEISETVMIGREGGDIVIDDMEVSRCHAEVKANNGQLVLTDLGSSNGTKLNGRRVSSQVLTDGDLIELGGSAFLIELGSDVRRNQATIVRPMNGETVTRSAILPQR